MAAPARAERVGRVLEALVWWSRAMTRTRTAPFGNLPLTHSQADALFVLAHSPSPVTNGSLAATLGLTAGAVTQLLDRLRRAGLVESHANPDDARSRVLRLSPDADARVRDFEREKLDALAPRFDALTDAELATLEGLLGRTAPR